MPPSKRKLTLSVDPAAIEAAKRAGINLSDLTEQILRVVGDDPDDPGIPADYEDYKPLFESLATVAKRHRTNIRVGELFVFDVYKKGIPWIDDRGNVPVWLTPSGKIGRNAFDDFEWEQSGPENWIDGTILVSERDLEVVRFDKPLEIVKNALQAIASAKKTRDARKKSVELAVRFVEVLTETPKESPSGPQLRARKESPGGNQPRPKTSRGGKRTSRRKRPSQSRRN